MSDQLRLLYPQEKQRAETEVVDKSGVVVDISGPLWRLNAGTFHAGLHWNKFPHASSWFIAAAKGYVVDRIKRTSPRETQNTFEDLRLFARELGEYEASGFDASEEIPYQFFSALRAKFAAENSEYRLHRLRAFYSWAADDGYEGFSPEVAFQFEQLRLSGNQKGVAVLSEDPEEGPLTEDEVTALLSRLRVAEALSLQERVALWLCFALGRNPTNYCLLIEDDLQTYAAEGVDAKAHELKVPRIKKRLSSVRSEL